MAEWRIEEVDGDNPIVWIDKHTYFVAEHDPSCIVNAHNADRAAYEARIAALEAAYQTLLESHEILEDSAAEDELRAELERVKAESLRVVYLPDDYEFMGDYYMTPDGVGWNSSDRHGDGCVETPEGYHKFDNCRKVKLERWEATIHPLQSLADDQVPSVPEFDAIAAEHFDELIGGVDT